MPPDKQHCLIDLACDAASDLALLADSLVGVVHRHSPAGDSGCLFGVVLGDWMMGDIALFYFDVHLIIEMTQFCFHDNLRPRRLQIPFISLNRHIICRFVISLDVSEEF